MLLQINYFVVSFHFKWAKKHQNTTITFVLQIQAHSLVCVYKYVYIYLSIYIYIYLYIDVHVSHTLCHLDAASTASPVAIGQFWNPRFMFSVNAFTLSLNCCVFYCFTNILDTWQPSVSQGLPNNSGDICYGLDHIQTCSHDSYDNVNDMHLSYSYLYCKAYSSIFSTYVECLWWSLLQHAQSERQGNTLDRSPVPSQHTDKHCHTHI